MLVVRIILLVNPNNQYSSWRGWGPFNHITLYTSYSYIRFVRMMVLVIPPCLPVSHANTSYCDFFLHHTINTSQSHNKTQHYITLLHITKKKYINEHNAVNWNATFGYLYPQHLNIFSLDRSEYNTRSTKNYQNKTKERNTSEYLHQTTIQSTTS